MSSITTALSSTNSMDHSYLSQIAACRKQMVSIRETTAAVTDLCELEFQKIEAAIATRHASFESLYNAPLTLYGKDHVMRDLAIVPVPICAAFLGLKSEDIFRFKRKNQSMGAIYHQSLCFSINEIEVLAKNRDWFVAECGYKYSALKQVPSMDFLLHGTYVGFEVVSVRVKIVVA